MRGVASTYWQLLAAEQAAVQALGLLPKAAVQIRKLPHAEEQLDSLPLLLVCPHELPESSEPWSSEDQALVKYRVEVALVAANDHDFGAADVDTYLGWREKIRKANQYGLGGQLAFFGEVVPEAPIDRGLLNEGYLYSRLAFRLWAVEPRAN